MAARKYAVVGNATTAASATLPLLTIISAATIRPQIYDYTISSDATPADNAAKYVLQRCTTTGTVGSAITPQALDPADPAALHSSGLAVFSVGPTLTASAFLGQEAVNQRATFRFIAAPEGNIIMPATASNGVAFMSTVTGGSNFNAVLSVYVQE